jgi:putative membrane protein insertion efficiency factor
MNKIVIFFVRIYQILISPFLGHNCRFAPSCSNYMIEAINKKGLIKGFCLGIYRLCKCNPFSKKSGFDPVE